MLPIFRQVLLAGTFLSAFAVSTAGAASFTVNPSATDNASKTLNGVGQTGLVNETGTLSTAGTAISGSALSTIIVNDGTIEATGAATNAIEYAGSDSTGSTIENWGIIRATGGGASSGVAVTPSGVGGVTITNQGTIQATGTGSSVRFFSDNNTLYNNGTLTSAASAVFVNGNNNRIILQSGSMITGTVDFAGGTGNTLEYSTQLNCPKGGGACTGGIVDLPTVTGSLGIDYDIVETGTGGSSLPSGSRTITVGADTISITPDGVISSSEITDENITQIIYIALSLNNYNLLAPLLVYLKIKKQKGAYVNVAEESDRIGINKGDDYAPSGAVLGLSDLPAEAKGAGCNNKAWGEGYGSYSVRPDYKSDSYGTSRSGGFVAGYDFPEMDDTCYGVFVSGFTGQTKIGKTTFRTIDGTGATIGGTAKRRYGDYVLTGQLIGGFSDNDSDRVVSSSEHANADYTSWFASPNLTIQRPVVLPEHEMVLIPSLTVGYMYNYAQGYTETGSSFNQRVDGHSGHSLNARAVVEAALAPKPVANGTLATSFRVGLEGKTDMGDQSIDVNVLGTDVTIDPKSDNTLDGIVGVNLNLVTTNAMEVYFDGEANIGINKGGPSDNMGGTAKVGMRWQF